MSGKQQNYDFDRIKYCVENLCANPDPDLVDALLDDDQLLAKSSENDPLPAIVKAFRALHEQLKSELDCALRGKIDDDQSPFPLLSMLGQPADYGYGLPAEEEVPVQSPIRKKKVHIKEEEEDKEDNDRNLEVISFKEVEHRNSRSNKEQKDKPAPLLELQFNEVVSIQPKIEQEDDDELSLIDRSVQVDSDLNPVESREKEEESREKEEVERVSAMKAYAREGREREELMKERGKEREELMREHGKGSEAPSSGQRGRERKAEIADKNESSENDQTTSSSSMEQRSIGEIDARKALQMMFTRSKMRLFTVDREGALVLKRTHTTSTSCSTRVVAAYSSQQTDGQNNNNNLSSSSSSTLPQEFSSSEAFNSSPTKSSASSSTSLQNRQINLEDIEVVSARQFAEQDEVADEEEMAWHQEVAARQIAGQPKVARSVYGQPKVATQQVARRQQEVASQLRVAGYQEVASQSRVAGYQEVASQPRVVGQLLRRPLSVVYEVSSSQSRDSAHLQSVEKNGEEDEDEELSTLNQVTPIPTTMELTSGNST